VSESFDHVISDNLHTGRSLNAPAAALRSMLAAFDKQFVRMMQQQQQHHKSSPDTFFLQSFSHDDAGIGINRRHGT